MERRRNTKGWRKMLIKGEKWKERAIGNEVGRRKEGRKQTKYKRIQRSKEKTEDIEKTERRKLNKCY
jgi:hypothetical protein